jgi:predicted dehydrogenase
MKIHSLIFLTLLLGAPAFSQDSKPPVPLAIIGLSHDHAMGFIPELKQHADVELVGIVETNRDLIARYSRQFNLNSNLFFPSIENLVLRTNVRAVATFTSIFEHKNVVEICARHGLDVMVEKPLAVNMRHARAIAEAAKKSGIQVIVNYETTWYPANRTAYVLAHDERKIGRITKMVFHDGHNGPKEIGCSTNFLAWLTDPILNGGGALNDFGCYGADLATWFMDGQRPISVFATTQHLKPKTYPKVEDDATIILSYPHAQIILQPSWDWPFSRKDMEIYGETGSIIVPEPKSLEVREATDQTGKKINPPPIAAPYGDPISYFTAVVRREIKPSGLSSLDVNLLVVEILDAAHRSAESGRQIKF